MSLIIVLVVGVIVGLTLGLVVGIVDTSVVLVVIVEVIVEVVLVVITAVGTWKASNTRSSTLERRDVLSFVVNPLVDEVVVVDLLKDSSISADRCRSVSWRHRVVAVVGLRCTIRLPVGPNVVTSVCIMASS